MKMFPTILVKISLNNELREKLRLKLGEFHEDFLDIFDQEEPDREEFECALTDLSKTLKPAYEVMKEVAESPETMDEEVHRQN